MSEIDEEIAKKMNEYKKGQHGTINDGIYVKEELMKFEETSFFNDKVKMMIPKSFQDMPKKLAELKYPSQFRPQVIKMNQTTDVNIMLNMTEQKIEDKDINTLAMQIRSGVMKMQPANIFFETGTNPKEKQVCSWFDFKSHTIDEKLYNLMAFYSIGGKLFHFSFCCRFKEYKLWKPIALQLLETVTEVKQESKE